jgi:hypothetical protein
VVRGLVSDVIGDAIGDVIRDEPLPLAQNPCPSVHGNGPAAVLDGRSIAGLPELCSDWHWFARPATGYRRHA